MTKLFLSFAQEDSYIVLHISRLLEAEWYEISISDYGIQGTGMWSSETVRGIDGCDIFVLFVSSKSILSDHVRRELDLAFDVIKKVLPVQIEKVNIPATWRYQLAGLQYIEYQKPDWKSRILDALGPGLAAHERNLLRTKTKVVLDVFICHSSGDKPAVRELYQKLHCEHWIDPWLDEEKLIPGQNWDLEIRNAVKTADIVIVCLSRGSVNKEGYVQKEIKQALDIAD